MIKQFTLAERLRTGHVKRWQIVRVAREQTIAEHMYRVHQIAMFVARQMKMTPAEILLVSEWSLAHDMPEVVTGDIATPTKMAMRRAVPDSDPIKHIELELDGDYHYLYQICKTQHPAVLAVVKLADIMEAVDFLQTEALGRHAIEVRTGLQKSFFAVINGYWKEFPEYNWQFVMDAYMELIYAEED